MYILYIKDSNLFVDIYIIMWALIFILIGLILFSNLCMDYFKPTNTLRLVISLMLITIGIIILAANGDWN